MYKNLIDMTGLKFDRLLVLSLAERALTTPVKSKKKKKEKKRTVVIITIVDGHTLYVS